MVRRSRRWTRPVASGIAWVLGMTQAVPVGLAADALSPALTRTSPAAKDVGLDPERFAGEAGRAWLAQRIAEVRDRTEQLPKRRQEKTHRFSLGQFFPDQKIPDAVWFAVIKALTAAMREGRHGLVAFHPALEGEASTLAITVTYHGVRDNPLLDRLVVDTVTRALAPRSSSADSDLPPPARAPSGIFNLMEPDHRTGHDLPTGTGGPAMADSARSPQSSTLSPLAQEVLQVAKEWSPSSGLGSMTFRDLNAEFYNVSNTELIWALNELIDEGLVEGPRFGDVAAPARVIALKPQGTAQPSPRSAKPAQPPAPPPSVEVDSTAYEGLSEFERAGIDYIAEMALLQANSGSLGGERLTTKRAQLRALLARYRQVSSERDLPSNRQQNLSNLVGSLKTALENRLNSNQAAKLADKATKGPSYPKLIYSTSQPRVEDLVEQALRNLSAAERVRPQLRDYLKELFLTVADIDSSREAITATVRLLTALGLDLGLAGAYVRQAAEPQGMARSSSQPSQPEPASEEPPHPAYHRLKLYDTQMVRAHVDWMAERVLEEAVDAAQRADKRGELRELIAVARLGEAEPGRLAQQLREATGNRLDEAKAAQLVQEVQGSLAFWQVPAAARTLLDPIIKQAARQSSSPSPDYLSELFAQLYLHREDPNASRFARTLLVELDPNFGLGLGEALIHQATAPLAMDTSGAIQAGGRPQPLTALMLIKLVAKSLQTQGDAAVREDALRSLQRYYADDSDRFERITRIARYQDPAYTEDFVQRIVLPLARGETVVAPSMPAPVAPARIQAATPELVWTQLAERLKAEGVTLSLVDSTDRSIDVKDTGSTLTLTVPKGMSPQAFAKELMARASPEAFAKLHPAFQEWVTEQAASPGPRSTREANLSWLSLEGGKSFSWQAGNGESYTDPQTIRLLAMSREILGIAEHRIQLPNGARATLQVTGSVHWPLGWSADAARWKRLLERALEREGRTLDDLANLPHKTLTIILADEYDAYAGDHVGDGIVILHRRLFDDPQRAFPANPFPGVAEAVSEAMVLTALAHELGAHELPKAGRDADTPERKAKDLATLKHFAESLHVTPQHLAAAFPKLPLAGRFSDEAIAQGIVWKQRNEYIFGGGFGYDIRINDAVTEQDDATAFAYTLGRTFGGTKYLGSLGRPTRALITGDQRSASDPFRHALIQGLADEGVEVVTQADDEVITTGLPSRKGLAEGFDLIVQVTGSHNLPNGNGFKITYQGLPFFQKQLLDLSQFIEQRAGWSDQIRQGRVIVQDDLVQEHVEALDRVLPALKNPPSLVVDFRRGAAGRVTMALAKRKGYRVIVLDSPEAPLPDEVFAADGAPVMIVLNHEPSASMDAGIWDPSKPEAFNGIRRIQQRVQADGRFAGRRFAGIAFDGDGDRSGFITEDGELFMPERMLMAFYQRMVLQNEAGIRALNRLGHTVKLALDVRASGVIIDVLKDIAKNMELNLIGEFIPAGFPNHRTFILQELQAIEGVLEARGQQLSQEERNAVRRLMLTYTSAEASGHFFFNVLDPGQFLRQKIVVDDGIASSFIFLHLVETMGEPERPGSGALHTVAEANRLFPLRPVTNEIRLEKAPADVFKKQELAEKIVETFARAHPTLIPMPLDELLAKVAAARQSPPPRQGWDDGLLLVDGIRLKLTNGVWILLRKSNTSAVIVFKAEADSPDQAAALVQTMSWLHEAIQDTKALDPAFQPLVVSLYEQELARLQAAEPNVSKPKLVQRTSRMEHADLTRQARATLSGVLKTDSMWVAQLLAASLGKPLHPARALNVPATALDGEPIGITVFFADGTSATVSWSLEGDEPVVNVMGEETSLERLIHQEEAVLDTLRHVLRVHAATPEPAVVTEVREHHGREFTIGMRFGGSNLTVGLADRSWREDTRTAPPELSWRRYFLGDTPDLDDRAKALIDQGGAEAERLGERVFEEAIRSVLTMVWRTGLSMDRCHGILVSFPGPVDDVAGIVATTFKAANIPLRRNFPMRERIQRALEAALGVSVSVRVKNDTEASLETETGPYGTAPGVRNVVYGIRGTGINDAALKDGQLFTAPADDGLPTWTETGHAVVGKVVEGRIVWEFRGEILNGRRPADVQLLGPDEFEVEQRLGGPALLEFMLRPAGFASWEAFQEAHAVDHPRHAEAVALNVQMGREMGRALAPLIAHYFKAPHHFEPEAIILGSGVIEHRLDDFITAFQQGFAESLVHDFGLEAIDAQRLASHVVRSRLTGDREIAAAAQLFRPSSVEPKMVVVPKPAAVDPALLEGLDLTQEKTIAVIGGLGSLPERFLKQGYRDIQAQFPNVRFIIVGRRDPRTEGDYIHERLRASGLPLLPGLEYLPAEAFESYATSDGWLEIEGRRIKIDGIIESVPTNTHLPIAKRWVARGVPVWMEKPVTMIEEVDEVRQLAADHPNKVFAADFFMDSDTLIHAVKDPVLLKRIGRIRAIHGRVVENWSVANEPRPWLMRPEESGGGLGIDILVHPLAVIAMILEAAGVDSRQMAVDEVVLGRSADLPAAVAKAGAPGQETYMWMRGHVPTTSGESIQLLVDGGKGVETVYYGLTIEGENGAIEIMFGTEEYEPYLRVTQGDQPALYRFQGGGLGYGRTSLDFLLLLYGSSKTAGASLDQRLRATTQSVELVGQGYAMAREQRLPLQAYDVGNVPSVPTPVEGRIPSTMPKTGAALFRASDSQLPSARDVNPQVNVRVEWGELPDELKREVSLVISEMNPAKRVRELRQVLATSARGSWEPTLNRMSETLTETHPGDYHAVKAGHPPEQLRQFDRSGWVDMPERILAEAQTTVEADVARMEQAIRQAHPFLEGDPIRYVILPAMGGSKEIGNGINESDEAWKAAIKDRTLFFLDTSGKEGLAGILQQIITMEQKRRYNDPLLKGLSGKELYDALLRDALERTIVLGISMGMTSEEPVINMTAAAELVFRNALAKTDHDEAALQAVIGAHFWSMTLDGSTLHEFLKVRQWGDHRLPIQLDGKSTLSGRNSYVSRVALLPLAFLGLSISDYLGAMAAPNFTDADRQEAFRLSAVLSAAESPDFGLSQPTFLLPDAYQPFGFWLRQGLEESEGKNHEHLMKIDVPHRVPWDLLNPVGPKQNRRLFIHVRAAGLEDPHAEDVEQLRRLGYAVVTVELPQAKGTLGALPMLLHFWVHTVLGVGYDWRNDTVGQYFVELYKKYVQLFILGAMKEGGFGEYEFERVNTSEVTTKKQGWLNRPDPTVGSFTQTEPWRQLRASPRQATFNGVTLYFDGMAKEAGAEGPRYTEDQLEAALRDLGVTTGVRGANAAQLYAAWMVLAGADPSATFGGVTIYGDTVHTEQGEAAKAQWEQFAQDVQGRSAGLLPLVAEGPRENHSLLEMNTAGRNEGVFTLVTRSFEPLLKSYPAPTSDVNTLAGYVDYLLARFPADYLAMQTVATYHSYLEHGRRVVLLAGDVTPEWIAQFHDEVRRLLSPVGNQAPETPSGAPRREALQGLPYPDRLRALEVTTQDPEDYGSLRQGFWAPAFPEVVSHIISPDVGAAAADVSKLRRIVIHSSVLGTPDAEVAYQRIQDQLRQVLGEGPQAIDFVTVPAGLSAEEQRALVMKPRGVVTPDVAAIIGPKDWAVALRGAVAPKATVASAREESGTVPRWGNALIAGVEAAAAGGRLPEKLSGRLKVTIEEAQGLFSVTVTDTLRVEAAEPAVREAILRYQELAGSK